MNCTTWTCSFDDGDDVVSGDDGTGNDEVPAVSTTNTREGGPAAIITAERVTNSRPTKHTTNTTTTHTTAARQQYRRTTSKIPMMNWNLSSPPSLHPSIRLQTMIVMRRRRKKL